MSREIVVSEADKIAVVLENGIVREFYLSEGEQYVGDIILATVESIVPAIEAAFLDIGRDKSGFIHVSDLPASKKQQSGIRQYLKPQQQLLVQVTREPTGNKGASLSGFIQLPGRFLVLTPFERRIGLSKRIYDARERARLARIARMICGSGYGIVLRPEAVGQSEQTLREDLKLLLARWKSILGSSEKGASGTTLYRDQDVLERILREGATASVTRIVVDSQATYDRAIKYFNNWSDTKARAKLRVYSGTAPILSNFGIYQQMEKAIQPLVQLPSGGTLVIQATEALTTIDVNTSAMTSTDNQPETILRTNIEAAEEAARQLVLRDIGGLIVIDFIDMDNPRDQQIVWQRLSDALQHDKSQPQISYFSEFGLVEMSRRRQRQRLNEMLTMPCPTCQGVGRIRNLLYRSDMLTGEGIKVRIPQLQAEEKTSRYRGGVEKSSTPPPPAPVAPIPVAAPAPSNSGGGGRQRGGSSKSRQTPQSQSSAHESAPVMEQMMYDEPDLEIKSKPASGGRAAAEEKPEDLLFDDSLFTAEITDEVLENYIEREDNLNVSGRLAGSLDELLARIDSNGLASIKRSSRGDEGGAYEGGDEGGAYEGRAYEDGEEESQLIDDYIAEEADEPDEGDMPAEAPEAADEVVEEAAPRSRRSRGGRSKDRQRPEPFDRAPAKPARAQGYSAFVRTPDEDEEAEPEAEVEETVHSQVEPGNEADVIDETADFDADDEGDEGDADDEGMTISPASLAESALTAKASALNKAKPAKRILTKRRTIRSFRPKR